METIIAQHNIRLSFIQRNIAIFLAILMLLGNLLLIITIFSLKQTTVIVPAHLKSEISLDQERVSKSYIEEMTVFFFSYLLDVTSSSADYKAEIILRHVSPDFFQAMKEYLLRESKKYQEFNLTTGFTPSALEIDEDSLIVTATGLLNSYFGKNGYKQELVHYQISYEYKNGRLFIKDFKLISTQEGAN
jgi:conjugal transfer pilus assembly protein TraE